MIFKHGLVTDTTIRPGGYHAGMCVCFIHKEEEEEDKEEDEQEEKEEEEYVGIHRKDE